MAVLELLQECLRFIAQVTTWLAEYFHARRNVVGHLFLLASHNSFRRSDAGLGLYTMVDQYTKSVTKLAAASLPRDRRRETSAALYTCYCAAKAT